jgi:Zn-dependent protease
VNEGAAVCVRCGFDLVAGRRIDTVVTPAAQAAAPSYYELLRGQRAELQSTGLANEPFPHGPFAAIKFLLCAAVCVALSTWEPSFVDLLFGWLPDGSWRVTWYVMAGLAALLALLSMLPMDAWERRLDAWLERSEARERRPTPSIKEALAEARRQSADQRKRDVASDEQVRAKLRRIMGCSRPARLRVLVLGVSALAFLGLGLIWFEAWWVAGLAAIVLLHEAGHVIAMKAFGYRNVSMVLVPFIGGAASGHRIGAPAWQQAIIALAGPLPGIGIGLVVLVASLPSNSQVLLAAGVMLVLINGFNLLPLLPLDGGRLLNALLFSRHPAMEQAFRLFAAAGLVAIGAFLQSWVLVAFGGFMLTGSIATNVERRAVEQLVERIRRDDLIAGADDSALGNEDEVPAEAPDELIAAAREALPKRQSAEALASVIHRAWDRAATPPSHPLATLAILIVYFATLAFSIAATLFVYVVFY